MLFNTIQYGTELLFQTNFFEDMHEEKIIIVSDDHEQSAVCG
jgi:hypothetical protein